MESCPKCGSSSIYKSKKYSAWICEDCGEKFSADVETKKKWNSGLLADEFWNHTLISVAPVSLSISYQQLYDYVEEGNIGCTLFLIRDVFELMIKLPVVMLLDGVYSVLERKEQPDEFLNLHPKLRALYANSMQILTTGKWWECVRLGAGLVKEFKNEELFSGESELAYEETAKYLQKIYKLFWFQIPGQDKTNMVSWRNRAVGHSCLASNPEENYAEIPYILKMFKNVGEISVSYYRRVSFADNSRNILRGTKLPLAGEELFIVYTDGGNSVFTKMHSFVAGKTKNLAYFDGYEKGKAYLLNYADGDRYKDRRLSEYLGRMDYSENGVILSESNIDAENLETADINQLENELSCGEKVVPVNYLYNWLMKQTGQHEKGIFLLQAERGMGKTTFCDTLDQLSASENVLRYSDDIDGWTDFMETSAIRVWHFNSTYFGRKDIYIPGIASAVLTLSNGHFENKKWIEANRLVGRLESMWDNLLACEEGLRHVYFAEVLNATIKEYQSRTDKERIVLVLDGLDEIAELNLLMSYIPDISELNSNVYLLFVSRTDDELSEVCREMIKKKAITSSLVFLRNQITTYESGIIGECIVGNEYYLNALETYAGNMFLDNSFTRNKELIEKFEHRFSEVTAYNRLCKMNPVFRNSMDTDLLKVFIDELMLSAPAIYCHKVEMILNALAWSGSALNIRELAYLSGEQYVSYRFVGMLYDLQAFIRIVRTENGNCYEFAHGEWEQAVKEKYPYGAIYFRKLCNKLLEEIEAESEEKDFFAEENQGELWLLANLLRVYNDSSEQLKKNWFEDVKIDNIAEIWVKILQKLSIDSKLDVTTTRGRKVLSIISRVWDDYDSASKCFYYDKHIGVACSTSNVTESRLAKVLMKSLSVKQTISSLAEEDEYYASASICKSLGNIFDRNAIRQSETEMKRNCALLADECYRQAGVFYNKGADASRLPDVIEMLYQSGRVCQIGGLTDRAKEYFEAALKIILEYTCEENSKVALYAARTCTRYGLLLNDSEEQFDYYLSAEKLLCDLMQKSCEAEYLAWRTWLYRLMAKWCEKSNQTAQALSYWKAAYKDAGVLCDIRGSYEDTEDRRLAMEGLTDSYISEKMWSETIPILETLIELDGNSIEYLRKLAKAYDMLEMISKKKDIEAKLFPMEEKELEYGNAYQEVSEVLKHMVKEDFEKIPAAYIEFLDKHANPCHKFKYDTSISFAKQDLLETTKYILFGLFEKFAAYNKQRDKINEYKKRWRMVEEVELLKEVLAVSNCEDYYSPELFLDSKRKHIDYKEVNWVLSNLPRNLLKLIPPSVLAEITYRGSMYDGENLELGKKNQYHEETLPIVKCLINTYVSNDIVAHVIKDVPDSFDLDIIFDNPDYQD